MEGASDNSSHPHIRLSELARKVLVKPFVCHTPGNGMERNLAVLGDQAGGQPAREGLASHVHEDMRPLIHPLRPALLTNHGLRGVPADVPRLVESDKTENPFGMRTVLWLDSFPDIVRQTDLNVVVRRTVDRPETKFIVRDVDPAQFVFSPRAGQSHTRNKGERQSAHQKRTAIHGTLLAVLPRLVLL
jgi:hypothetical protein